MFAWTRAQVLLILALTSPVPARSACQVELLELPVKMIGSRAVATVGINGMQVPLTVDSGAFFSFLTEAAATQLNLRLRQAPSALRIEGITGRVDARVTTVDKLQLLKGDIPRVDFVVGGNEPGAGTMGLMGRNLLAFTDTEYDLANGMIRLSFPNDDCTKANLAYWAGASHVSEVELEPEYRSRSKTPPLRARVKLNGTELVALLDTGASTLVSLRSARRAGVAEAQMTPSGAVYGAGRGSARRWTAPFAKVEIGDETITNNRLHVGDFTLDDADLLLGIDFFLSHRIYVSKQQGKMYFTYNGGTVFALNRSDSVGAVPFTPEQAASEPQVASADQLARRAASLAARQEYERALAELTRAVELEPTSAAHYAQRGGVLEALRRPTTAIEDYDKAIELDSAQTDARFRRAVLRLGLKNREGALADLDALDKALATQAQLRLAMSALYLQLEQPARTIVQLDHWLSAHPNEERRQNALNSRCWARALIGVDLEKALDDCNDAIARDGKNAAYFDSRGWVQLRLGRYEKAVADFDRALALRPGLAFPLYGRGLAKTRLGEVAQGQADLDAARNSQADIDSRVKRAGLLAEHEPKV
jgi:tetratricopeptide (TPR) repeat protein/predicted aspartyl protease